MSTEGATNRCVIEDTSKNSSSKCLIVLNPCTGLAMHLRPVHNYKTLFEKQRLEGEMDSIDDIVPIAEDNFKDINNNDVTPLEQCVLASSYLEDLPNTLKHGKAYLASLVEERCQRFCRIQNEAENINEFLQRFPI